MAQKVVVGRIQQTAVQRVADFLAYPVPDAVRGNAVRCDQPRLECDQQEDGDGKNPVVGAQDGMKHTDRMTKDAGRLELCPAARGNVQQQDNERDAEAFGDRRQDAEPDQHRRHHPMAGGEDAQLADGIRK
jgi:hypothetical protein